MKEKLRLTTSNKALMVCGAIAHILVIFLDTFMIAYIYSQCDKTGQNPFLIIGEFYFIFYCILIFFYWFFSRFLKNHITRRVFYIVGIFLKFTVILSIVLLGEKICDYIVYLAILHAFAETFYWTAFNVIKNMSIDKELYHKYTLIDSEANRVLGIIIPIILGKIIDISSFIEIAIYVLILSGIQLVSSFFVKTKDIPLKKYSIKDFLNTVAKTPLGIKPVKHVYSMYVLSGLRVCTGSILTCLIIEKFGSNVSLGALSSILAIIGIICLFIFTSFPKIGRSKISYLIFAILPVIAMFVLVFNTTKTTIILYQLTTTICLLTLGFNQGKYRFSIIKNIGQNDYIPEHQAFVDCSFTLGRIVSYGFLLIVGLTGSMVLQQILLITFVLTIPIEMIINYKLDKEDAFLLKNPPTLQQ